jgi:hypothetical protein
MDGFRKWPVANMRETGGDDQPQKLHRDEQANARLERSRESPRFLHEVSANPLARLLELASQSSRARPAEPACINWSQEVSTVF